MSLLYACVARDTTILAEHENAPEGGASSSSAGKGVSSNAAAVASLVLSKLDASKPQKLTYVYEGSLIHYIVTPPLTFLCIASDSLGRKIPFTLLLQVENDFTTQWPHVAELPAYGAASYNKQLAGMMALAERGEANPAKHVQEEISQVKDILSENISKILDRGDRLDNLITKTDNLNQSAFAFKKRSTTLRRQMWWKNVKLLVLLGVVIIMIIYLFVGFGCGLPAWQRCL